MSQAVTVIQSSGAHQRTAVFRGALVAGHYHAIARAFLEPTLDSPYISAPWADHLRKVFGLWQHKSYAMAFTGISVVDLSFSFYAKPPVLCYGSQPYAVLPTHASDLHLRISTEKVEVAPPQDPIGLHPGFLS